MDINLDKIINVNRIFGGTLKDKNAIEFAIEEANKQKNVYKKLSYLIRSLTSDHAFWDGNKRTAITIILDSFSENNIKYDPNRLVNTIISLAETGEGNLNKIEERLRKCSRK